MSDSKPLNDWVKDWEALQRQYLGAWSDLMQKVPGGAPPPPPFSTPFGAVPGMFGAGFGAPPAPAPGWHEGLEQWSRMFSGKGGAGDTMERMIESSKAYIGMIKAMLGGAAAAGGDDGTNPGQAWLDALRGGMGGMPGFQMPDAMSGFQMPGIDALSANPFFKAIRDIAGNGAKGLGDLPASFAPFLEQFRQQNMSWLRMPAFGLAREHQEHYQRTAVAFVEYQEALRGYNALLLKASQRGLELMESKLAERSEPGRTIDSPRALYDLWVDAAEEAYAEIALSDEFGKAYGELANAQMRMRAQIQAEVERVGTDLGMPTRSELDSVHQRLHDLRREFRDRGEGSAAIADLEAEVAALRAEVERLASAAEAARLDANAAPARTKSQVAEPARAKSAKPARAKKTSVKKTTGRNIARRASSKDAVAKTTGATRGGANQASPRGANAVGARKAEVSQIDANNAGMKKSNAKKRSAKPVATKPARAAKRPAASVAPASTHASSTARKAADARKVALAEVFAPSPATLAASASARPVPTKSKGRRADRRARAKVAPTPRDAAASSSAPTSFGDAIAAMRKRVARSGKSGRLKSVAAQFVGPHKSADAKMKRAVGAQRKSSKSKGKA